MSIKRRALSVLAGLMPGLWERRVRNPIFIIGCARSGTTILANLIGQHRDVINWSELNDLWDPNGFPWHRSSGETPPIWIDPVAYTARWWRDTEPRQREIRALFGAYQTLNGKPVIVNKTPLNTFRIPYLLQIFPAARFIHIIRDGRAVVNSYTRKQQYKMQTNPAAFDAAGLSSETGPLSETLAIFWQTNIDEVDRQDAALKLSEQGMLLTCTYEALCANPREELAAVARYMGVDPARFDPAVYEVPLRNQNHKWRESFTDAEAARLTELMEPALSNKGYA